MFASGNSLTLCSGGALAHVGAYISLSGMGVMGIGAGMGIGGSYILAKSSKLKDLNSNKDSLSNLKNSGQKKIEFKMFDNYRVTHHLGSELIEIQVLRHKKSWFTDKYVWERIYMGHADPIQFSLEFWEKSRKEEKSKA